MGGRTQRSGTAQRWLNSDRTSVIRRWRNPGHHQERKGKSTSSLVDVGKHSRKLTSSTGGMFTRCTGSGRGTKVVKLCLSYVQSTSARYYWLVHTILLSTTPYSVEFSSPAHSYRVRSSVGSLQARKESCQAPCGVEIFA